MPEAFDASQLALQLEVTCDPIDCKNRTSTATTACKLLVGKPSIQPFVASTPRDAVYAVD